jgi:hypothetical protein
LIGNRCAFPWGNPKKLPLGIFQRRFKLANIEKHDSVDLTPLTRDTGHSHEVTGQAKHLKSKIGEKASSVSQPLVDFANPEHDVEAQFSTHPKNLRGHIDAAYPKEEKR